MTRIDLHTRLFFFRSTKETFFPTLFPFPQYVASFKDLLVEVRLPSPLLEINKGIRFHVIWFNGYIINGHEGGQNMANRGLNIYS